MRFEKMQEVLIDPLTKRGVRFAAESVLGIDKKREIDIKDKTLMLCAVRLKNANYQADLQLILPLIKLSGFEFFDCPDIKVEKLVTYLKHLKLDIDDETIISNSTKKRIKDNISMILPSLEILEKDLKSKNTAELISVSIDSNSLRLLAGIAIGATVAGYIINSH